MSSSMFANDEELALLRKLDGKILCPKDLLEALDELIRESGAEGLHAPHLFAVANNSNLVRRMGDKFRISFTNIQNVKKPA